MPLCHGDELQIQEAAMVSMFAGDPVKWLCMSKAVRIYLAELMAHSGREYCCRRNIWKTPMYLYTLPVYRAFGMLLASTASTWCPGSLLHVGHTLSWCTPCQVCSSPE